MHIELTSTDVARFWRMVRRDESCWTWTSARNKSGHGRFAVWRHNHMTNLYAHRVSWQIHFGMIPDGLYICHRCDNPPCVRPDHLFMGTQTDNMHDAARKGRTAAPASANPLRYPRGARHWNARLSEDQVRSIRASQESNRTLARRFGVSEGTVRRARSHEGWVHVA